MSPALRQSQTGKDGLLPPRPGELAGKKTTHTQESDLGN